MPSRWTFVAASGGTLFPTLFSLPTALFAQGTVKMRRVGLLALWARSDAEMFLGKIRQELEKLGWTEGRNLVLLEPRATAGVIEGLPLEAAELVAQGPDLILVQSLPATRALMQATKSIPIVMVGVGNPIEFGIVADYRRPGGNVTGSSFMANEYAVKLLGFLKEAVPRLRSVALFTNPSNEAAAPYVKLMLAQAMTLGMQAQIVQVASKRDLEPVFAAIRSANTQSILLPPEPLILSNREAIAGFAQTHVLPLAMVGTSRALPPSGLIAFGPERDEYAQLAARYVDRLLGGAKPGDLPIEQTRRFSLVLNLKAAKTLGVTLPQAMLLRADEVIQ